jgi:hypothetical protein
VVRAHVPSRAGNGSALPTEGHIKLAAASAISHLFACIPPVLFAMIELASRRRAELTPKTGHLSSQRRCHDVTRIDDGHLAARPSLIWPHMAASAAHWC